MDFKEVRAKFPQYSDLSDEQLGQALHKKFYADMPYEKFAVQIGLTKTQNIGEAGFPEAIKQTVAETSRPAKFMAAFGTALDNPALRLKQAIVGLTPEDRQRVLANREFASGSPAGAVAGNIGMLAMPAGRVQALLPQVLGGIPAAAAVGAGTAMATTPTLPGESEAGVAGMGAVGGAAGQAGANVAARVAQPIMQSAPVRKLLSEGIVPTPGAAAGGFLSRVEQKLSSIPLVGDIINRGRQRAVTELNTAAIRRAGGSMKFGREAIEQADDAIGEGYRAVLGRMTVKPDSQFINALQRIKADPDIALPKGFQTQFDDIIQQQVWQRFGNATQIPGELAKRADSTLGALARRYGTSVDGDQRALAVALREAQGAFRGMIERSAPDAATATALKELNSKYANFLRVERAAASVASADGRFTPQQLQSAVKALDPSKGKRAFAQGRALMQDISDPARQVLADVVPNSGTTDRALLAMLGMGGLAGANEFFGGPGYLTMLGASPLLYSRMGSRYMIGDLPAQQAIANAIRTASPAAVQAGVTLAK